MATLSVHSARAVGMRLSIILIASAMLAAGLVWIRRDLQTAYTLHQLRRIYPDYHLVTLRYWQDGWITFDVGRAPRETADSVD